MHSAREYHLYIQPHLKILIFGLLTLFAVMGLLMLTGVFHSPHGNGPPRLIGLIWICIVIWYWYLVLTIPHTITVSESGLVEFKSFFRKQLTAMREINSIKPYGGQFGFLQIKTSTGKIRIVNQFDGFHDFVSQLKAVNPSVELRGC